MICAFKENITHTVPYVQTFDLSDLPTGTVAPTAITIQNGDGVVSVIPLPTDSVSAVTIQNGDGVVSVIPLPTDSADSAKIKRLIKELDSRGHDSSKLKKLFTKKSA